MMKTIAYTFIFLGILALAAGCSGNASAEAQMKECALQGEEIQHMVIFNLPYEEGSAEARTFLDDGARILAAIPVVEDFQAFRQVSEKNEYQYGFSMVFANQDAYDSYNLHPDHVAFVQERWMKEVTDFLEIDFRGLP